MLRAGLPAPRGRMVLVYLNGLLWGLCVKCATLDPGGVTVVNSIALIRPHGSRYTLHERPDEHFCASYGASGGSADDYDVIKHESTIVASGNNDGYLDAMRMVGATNAARCFT